MPSQTSTNLLAVRADGRAPDTVYVQVAAPRVSDKRTDADTGQRQRFSSAIPPPWARKTRPEHVIVISI
jgi:hypothetical protein